MEDFFKSLNESVSEECFNDIMGIVEDLLDEAYTRMIDKVEKVAPNDLDALKKAYKFDDKMYKKLRPKTPKEEAEEKRLRDSYKEKYNREGRWGDKNPKRHSITSFTSFPDYQKKKKLAKEALKKGIPGTKRNTRAIRDAKKGDANSLYVLGGSLEARKKGKKAPISYNKKKVNDDYMDSVSRKSPGVSYTSAEWNDND